MSRLLSGTRYLIIVPIIGLALTAIVFFVFGGLNLINLLINTFLQGAEVHGESIPFEVQIVAIILMLFNEIQRIRLEQIEDDARYRRQIGEKRRHLKQEKQADRQKNNANQGAANDK